MPPAQAFHQEFCCADMSALEAEVRGVNKDGLLWGACEFPSAIIFSPGLHYCISEAL